MRVCMCECECECVCIATFGTFSSVTACLEKSLSIYVCLPFFIFRTKSNHVWVFFFFISLHPHAFTQLSLSHTHFFCWEKFKHWSKFVIATRLQLNIIYDPIFQVRQASLGKWIKAIWKVSSFFSFSFRCSVMLTWICVVCICVWVCVAAATFFSLDAKHQPSEIQLMLVGLAWLLASFFGFVLCALHRFAVKLHTNNTLYMQFTCIKNTSMG